MNVASVVLLAAGSLFMLLGSVGILRLPDFYCRTHAASKIDTVGVMLVLAGLCAGQTDPRTAVKLALVALFVAIANPVAAHALAGSALGRGLRPWSRRAGEDR